MTKKEFEDAILKALDSPEIQEKLHSICGTSQSIPKKDVSEAPESNKFSNFLDNQKKIIELKSSIRQLQAECDELKRSENQLREKTERLQEENEQLRDKVTQRDNDYQRVIDKRTQYKNYSAQLQTKCDRTIWKKRMPIWRKN